MSVELVKDDDVVVLRSSAPVFVTVSHWGRGARRAFLKHLDIIWEYNHRPNGKVRYRGVLRNMPVARFMVGLTDGHEAPVFRTPGGVVFKLEADLVALPADLEEQAEALGLLPRLEPKQQEAEHLSRELSEYLGTKVKVRISDNGKLIIGGELTDTQKMFARGWLQSRLNSDATK